MNSPNRKLVIITADDAPVQQVAASRIIRAAARRNISDKRVDDVRNDTPAECRWWNDLENGKRSAFVLGAKAPDDCARNDWLDIGETNRHKILSAAYAVECWLAEDDD